MADIFLNIYDYLRSRRWLVLSLLVALLGLFGVLASHVKLKENIADFLPQDTSVEQVRFVMDNMPQANNIVINILPAHPDSSLNKEYSARASELLAAITDSLCRGYIDSMYYKVSDQTVLAVTEFVAQNVAYYLDSNDYERLDSTLSDGGIDGAMAQGAELLGSTGGGMMLPLILNDPLLTSSSALEELRRLDASGRHETFDGYLFAANGASQLMVANVVHNQNQTDLNTPMVERLKEAIDSTQRHFPEIRIIYFGPATIAVSNASQIKADSFLAIGLSLFLIMVLLWYALRGVRAMALVMTPVLFGAAFALGVIYLLQGHISAIALGAGSIIFGVAISYSIHFVLHAVHGNSMKTVIRDLSSPMTVGSLSTIGAFLSLLFLSGQSMRDFGLFAALSLVGAILFTLIFLPHLLGAKKVKTRSDVSFNAVSSYHFERNRYVVWGLILGSIVLAVFASRTSFDTDLRNINYMSSGEREAMARAVADDSLTTTLYVAAIGSDMEQALVANERVSAVLDSLTAAGKIAYWSGIRDFVPSKSLQRTRIDNWLEFWTPDRVRTTGEQITRAARKAGFREGTFAPYIARLQIAPDQQGVEFFNKIPAVSNYIIKTDGRCAVLNILKVDKSEVAGVREEVASRGLTVFDTQTINRGLIDSLVEDFNFVLYVCGFIVFALLWLSFRRIEITLIAFVPMVLSWVWILGLMELFGLSFNVVNVILASFIFGLGDDFSIFITDGLMRDYAYGGRVTRSHKSAVVLSSLTMLLGIGTLIFSSHPAMLSLAQVTIIGMVSVVIMTYVVPPLIFGCLVSQKGRPRLAPVTMENLTKSIYAFIVFLIGSLGLTIYGFVRITIMGRSDKNKLKYHQALCGLARYVVRNLPMCPNRVLNPTNESFQRPAVIIANHQSHLDLMFMLTFSPKVVILTNHWVWRSPFYGVLIRYADFLPIAEGIENSVAKLRPLVDNGYSIVVFPESTRSLDGHIGRFHKGAFYLAEQLGVDLLPVVTHGIGDALPKQEFLLRPSFVTVSIMERIAASANYNSVAKTSRQIMTAEHERLKSSYQTPAYFRRRVIYNYIYKGVAVERDARSCLKRNGNYQAMIDALPTEGNALITNCGIGVGALMAALARPQLTIYATDEDAQKLALAANCASVPENLHYVATVPSDITFKTTADCYEKQ